MNIQRDIVLGKLTEEEKRDLEVLIGILSADEEKLIHDEQKKLTNINKEYEQKIERVALLKRVVKRNQKKLSGHELRLKTLKQKQTNPLVFFNTNTTRGKTRR